MLTSMPMLFFPRLECSSSTCTAPIEGITPLEARPRMASPRSGCSILMTSAPQSARMADAAGTKVCSATSRMRTPSMMSGNVNPSPSSDLARRELSRSVDSSRHVRWSAMRGVPRLVSDVIPSSARTAAVSDPSSGAARSTGRACGAATASPAGAGSVGPPSSALTAGHGDIEEPAPARAERGRGRRRRRSGRSAGRRRHRRRTAGLHRSRPRGHRRPRRRRRTPPGCPLRPTAP